MRKKGQRLQLGRLLPHTRKVLVLKGKPLGGGAFPSIELSVGLVWSLPFPQGTLEGPHAVQQQVSASLSSSGHWARSANVESEPLPLRSQKSLALHL